MTRFISSSICIICIRADDLVLRIVIYYVALLNEVYVIFNTKLDDSQTSRMGTRHVLSLNDFRFTDVRSKFVRKDPDRAGCHRLM